MWVWELCGKMKRTESPVVAPGMGRPRAQCLLAFVLTYSPSPKWVASGRMAILPTLALKVNFAIFEKVLRITLQN